MWPDFETHLDKRPMSNSETLKELEQGMGNEILSI